MHSAFAASRRAGSPLVRLVEGEERWEAMTTPGYSYPNRGGIEENRTVNCMVLKAKANNRRKSLILNRDEFRGP
ncbi:hypothetical protein TNCV_581481 [Trichonephila clavipes]|nr:hypothetical protein TNCV_581481 [Trichonephila clavipes]